MSRTDSTLVPDYPALLRLDGRGIIVIGAGQGIGRQAAHAVSVLGARAVCVDRDADLAEDMPLRRRGLGPGVGARPEPGDRRSRTDTEVADQGGRAGVGDRRRSEHGEAGRRAPSAG